MSSQDQTHPSSLSAYWMPFTANRNFKAAPRMLVSAEGMHYRDDAGNSETQDGVEVKYEVQKAR